MTDWTGVAAVIAPITTLLGVLGGYGLAGRNEQARDQRAIQREARIRRDALAERLEEDRHTFQRDTLLELQDELQRLARTTAQAIMQDQKSIKERGQIDLLEGDLSDQAFQITVSVQRLRARVLDDELRAEVGRFVSTCAAAGLGLTGYPGGRVADEDRQAAVDRLERVMFQMGQDYAQLTKSLGNHLRRELDRRFLAR